MKTRKKGNMMSRKDDGRRVAMMDRWRKVIRYGIRSLTGSLT